MDSKMAFYSYVDILLRVPFLFILDEVFQSRVADLGLYPSTLLPMHKELDFDDATGESNHTLIEPHHSLTNYNFGKLGQNLINVIEYDMSSPLSSYLNTVLCHGIYGLLFQIFLLFTASCIAFFALTLWTKHLVKLYEYLFTLLMVTLSQCSNERTFLALKRNTTLISSTLNLEGEPLMNTLPLFLSNVIFQAILATGYLVYQDEPRFPGVQRICALCFLLPGLTLLLPIDNLLFIYWCYFFLMAHGINVIFRNYSSICSDVKARLSYVIAATRSEKMLNFAEGEWIRLNIPLILRSFWLIRSGIYVYIYIATSEPGTWSDKDNLKILMKILLVRGCETLPAILGMSAMFSWIIVKIYTASQAVILIPCDEPNPIGPVAATLFIILSWQYGLSTLKPVSRLVRLMRIIVLIISCILHFVHNAIDPILMSLGASANFDVIRHVRVLMASGFLWFFSLAGLILLWTTHSVSTWLLAVSGFGMEAIFKISISLALYGLFLYDAKRGEFWSKLDDHVYRIKFTGRVLELVVGIFILSNSGFSLACESGGSFRAFLFGFQGYMNLWGEARTGWKIFTRRRIAVRKIDTLDTVDPAAPLDDICAICFHDLSLSGRNNGTVKVTRCRHFYHAVCLRKWLYVQDRCPICHQTLWPELSTKHVKISASCGEQHAHLD